MEIINNQDKLLGDDLKHELKRGSRVRIAASCFSIYAFDALKEELKDIEELQFIFSSPAFIEDKVSDKLKKEKREFYIPQQLMESSLYGTQFKIKLRNKLIQIKDLQNQLALAYGDGLEAFENKLETEHSIRKIFLRAQKVFNDWSMLPQEERKARDLINQLDLDFAIVLDSVTIARSRNHIYYIQRGVGKSICKWDGDSP